MINHDLPPEILPKKRSVIQQVFRRGVLLGLITIGGLFLISFSGRVPDDIGDLGGKLAACPDSPNCVSTQATDLAKKMAPVGLPVTDDDRTSIEKIKSVIAGHFPRATLVTEKENYLHYEFASLIFRFVGDVEFLIDIDNQQIDFRSASRVGHSDLGANAKRMRKISGLLRE